MLDDPIQIAAVILALIPAATVHEVAHGWTAEKFGDLTARVRGRITLNPIKHVDPFSTLALPLILIAVKSPFILMLMKPVPVDLEAFKRPRLGRALMALAGPASNVLMGAIAIALLYVFGLDFHHVEAGNDLATRFLASFLFGSLLVNAALAIFNMTPWPPFDGGHIVTAALPDRIRSWIDRHYLKISLVGLPTAIGGLYLLGQVLFPT